jgi:septum formation protein
MLHELLKDKKLVLASASPRRLDIFKMLGLNPLVIPADVHEPIDERPPWLLVKTHASHKANTIKQLFDVNSVIVAADTLVYIDKTTLGKPESRAEAETYLKMLYGNTHVV